MVRGRRTVPVRYLAAPLPRSQRGARRCRRCSSSNSTSPMQPSPGSLGTSNGLVALFPCCYRRAPLLPQPRDTRCQSRGLTQLDPIQYSKRKSVQKSLIRASSMAASAAGLPALAGGSEFLVVEPNTPPSDWRDSESIKTYKYPLDYFQKWAVRAMNKEENVMACVATGSGKSTLADYAIALSFSKQKRLFFTSPIKALSNQKFSEFKAAYCPTYGEGCVGLMTGDLKFNPDAPCIIMTAEILRNLLFKRDSATQALGFTSQLSLDNVDTVVMDEVHYINDAERGHVWEETLVMLPLHIKLVLLSATIDSPERIAAWVGRMKKRTMHLISNTARVVPLQHYLFKPAFFEQLADEQGKARALVEYMDNDGRWTCQGFKSWAKDFNKMEDETLAPGSDAHDKQSSKTYAGRNRLNNLVVYLKNCSLCPAILFIFSRKQCEFLARSLEERMVDGKQGSEIERMFTYYTQPHKAALEQLPQYHTLREMLQKGIAYHHSGLVPILKEVVEVIFARGLIKILFATETFAVGLNMPTKTVVFLEVNKPGDDGRRRCLKTDEYLQMAGRAGRRGIDPKGVVIYCPLRKPEFEDTFRAMATGRKSAFSSRMDFGFAFIFKALHSQSYHWTAIVQESFWFVELMTHKDSIAREISKIEISVADLEHSLGPYIVDLIERHKIDVNEELMSEKDRQKKLGAWDNKHIGKIWQTRYTDWKQLQVQRERLIGLREEHAATGDMELFMRGYATYLEMTGFLKELPENCHDLSHANLTLKGQLATECNETNCVLAPELFLWLTTTDEGHAALPEDPRDLVALLTLFMTQVSVGSRRDDEDGVLGANSGTRRISSPEGAIVEFVLRKRDDLRDISDQMGLGLPESTWSLTMDKDNCVLYSMVWEWMNGLPISEIVGTYDIDEGSLIRTMLKMGNVVEEWRNLATHCGQADMLQFLQHVDGFIFREIVAQDSLYVRI